MLQFNHEHHVLNVCSMRSRGTTPSLCKDRPTQLQYNYLAAARCLYSHCVRLFVEGMEYLDLSGNALRVLNNADLRPVGKLRFLNLSFNALTFLPSLPLPSLLTLDISHNQINSVQEENFDGKQIRRKC